LELPLTDLSDLGPGMRERELERCAREEAKKSFDLQRDLLLRVRLFRFSPTEHALMLVMHHIASDGWSMAVIYRELGTAYDAITHGETPKLAELPIQYADF